jgi:hypothetical protein
MFGRVQLDITSPRAEVGDPTRARLQITSGRASTDSSLRRPRQGSGDRANPHRDARAKQWRQSPKTSPDLARTDSNGVAEAHKRQAAACVCAAFSSRSTARAFASAEFVYFPAFTARDHLSGWTGDDHIRSFGRKGRWRLRPPSRRTTSRHPSNRTVPASNPPETISANRSSSSRDTAIPGCGFMKLINAGARCRHPELTGARLSGPVSSPRRSASSSRPS